MLEGEGACLALVHRLQLFDGPHAHFALERGARAPNRIASVGGGVREVRRWRTAGLFFEVGGLVREARERATGTQSGLVVAGCRRRTCELAQRVHGGVLRGAVRIELRRGLSSDFLPQSWGVARELTREIFAPLGDRGVACLARARVAVAEGNQILHCCGARQRQRGGPRILRWKQGQVLRVQCEPTTLVRGESDPVVRPQRARIGVGGGVLEQQARHRRRIGAAREREQEVLIGLRVLLRGKRLATVAQRGLQLALLRDGTAGKQQCAPQNCDRPREGGGRQDLQVTAPARAH